MPLRRVLAALCLLSTLALAACSGGAGPPPASAACTDSVLKAQLAPARLVLVALGARDLADAARRAAYRGMFSDVLACLGPGTRLVLLPVTGQRAAYASPVLDAAAPQGQNPLLVKQQRAAFQRMALAAFAAIRPDSDQNGVLEAMLPAAAILQAARLPAASTALVLLDDGWPQSPLWNAVRYDQPPSPAEAAALLERTRAQGLLASLPAGTPLLMAGIIQQIGGPGSPSWPVDSQLFVQLRSFWLAIWQSLGGRLPPAGFGQLLPGETAAG